MISSVGIDNKEFLKSLDEYERMLTEALKKSTLHLMQEVADVLIESTPVGDDESLKDWYLDRYLEEGWAPYAGMLMANWYFELNAVDGLFDEDARDTDGQYVKSSLLEAMQSFKIGDSILVTNETPYAGEIEDGSSSQSPQGMLKPVEDSIPSIYKISFEEFLNV